jgi:anti-sigma factor RsiW
MSTRESCEAIEPLLAPYGENAAADCAGVLTDADRARVEAHLAACAPCRRAAEACRAARDAVRGHAGDLTAAAPGLLAARCRAIAARESRPRRATRWVGWSAAGATAAVILFVFLMPTQAVATQLAADHMKCAKFSADSAHKGTPAQLETVWRDRRQRAISIPDSNPAQGLRLIGLRRCMSTEGSVAHVMYEQGGAPLSLFVLDGGGALDQLARARPGLAEVEALGHKAILWTTGAATYVVVGKGANLLTIAAWMRAETARRGTDD